VWAPTPRSVVLHVATGEARGDHALSSADDAPGVLVAHVAGVRAGDRYGYRLDGGDPLPDPVSRAQPDMTLFSDASVARFNPDAERRAVDCHLRVISGGIR